jgi:hypothetical protein
MLQDTTIIAPLTTDDIQLIQNINSPNDVTNLSPNIIASLNIEKMHPYLIPMLQEEQIKALTFNQLKKFSVEQIQEITPYQIHNLTPQQILNLKIFKPVFASERPPKTWEVAFFCDQMIALTNEQLMALRDNLDKTYLDIIIAGYNSCQNYYPLLYDNIQLKKNILENEHIQNVKTNTNTMKKSSSLLNKTFKIYYNKRLPFLFKQLELLSKKYNKLVKQKKNLDPDKYKVYSEIVIKDNQYFFITTPMAERKLYTAAIITGLFVTSPLIYVGWGFYTRMRDAGIISIKSNELRCG